MMHLIPMFIIVLFVFLLSLIFGSWEDIIPNHKETFTVKLGSYKITYNRKTGKITKIK